MTWSLCRSCVRTLDCMTHSMMSTEPIFNMGSPLVRSLARIHFFEVRITRYLELRFGVTANTNHGKVATALGSLQIRISVKRPLVTVSYGSIAGADRLRR